MDHMELWGGRRGPSYLGLPHSPQGFDLGHHLNPPTQGSAPKALPSPLNLTFQGLSPILSPRSMEGTWNGALSIPSPSRYLCGCGFTVDLVLRALLGSFLAPVQVELGCCVFPGQSPQVQGRGQGELYCEENKVGSVGERGQSPPHLPPLGTLDSSLPSPPRIAWLLYRLWLF